MTNKEISDDRDRLIERVSALQTQTMNLKDEVKSLKEKVDCLEKSKRILSQGLEFSRGQTSAYESAVAMIAETLRGV